MATTGILNLLGERLVICTLAVATVLGLFTLVNQMVDSVFEVPVLDDLHVVQFPRRASVEIVGVEGKIDDYSKLSKSMKLKISKVIKVMARARCGEVVSLSQKERKTSWSPAISATLAPESLTRQENNEYPTQCVGPSLNLNDPNPSPLSYPAQVG